MKRIQRTQKLFLSFLFTLGFLCIFPASTNAVHHCVKVIFVGNFNSGKTSILRCFTQIGNRTDENDHTYGMSYVTIPINNHNGNDYMVDLWDTAGEENYYSLQKQYFRDTNIAVIVVNLKDHDYITRDGTNHHNSLWDTAVMAEHVERWFDDVQTNADHNCRFI